jgi:hypothetical protein
MIAPGLTRAALWSVLRPVRGWAPSAERHCPFVAARGPSRRLAVSCASNTACTAVGYYNTAPPGEIVGRPLAERWNGSTWSLRGAPTIAGSDTTYLEGVSCTSSRACIAVGGSLDYFKGPLVAGAVGRAVEWRRVGGGANPYRSLQRLAVPGRPGNALPCRLVYVKPRLYCGRELPRSVRNCRATERHASGSRGANRHTGRMRR